MSGRQTPAVWVASVGFPEVWVTSVGLQALEGNQSGKTAVALLDPIHGQSSHTAL